MAERKNSLKKMNAEIASKGVTAVPSGAAPADLSKAAALTQAAISGLGGPVFASMQDHAPTDGAMVKAKTDLAIQKQGIVAVPTEKAPVDRAISEALTMKAIGNASTKQSLKKTETKESELDLKALQADAKAEKDAKAAARTFGGGDAKAGMPNILKEIEGQGGVIAVPSEKAPVDSGLAQQKALMEIEALKGQPIYASGTDGKVTDKALEQAKLLHQIGHKGESSVDSAKVAKVESRATSEALTMIAVTDPKKKASLKNVAKPVEGLSTEKLAELQKLAIEEKEE